MSTEAIVFGLSHVDVPVNDLARAERFYTQALGFQRKASGEGWVDLDASTLCIRLLHAPGGDRRAALRVHVSRVETTVAALVKAGATELYAPVRTAAHEVEGVLADPEGNRLYVWRPLSEDEYGYLPELPIETQWSEEAQALLKSILLSVPALFRSLARRKVVKMAEELYPQKVIAPIDVVRALILASAKVTRSRLVKPLQQHGYDPNDFRAEFEA